MTDFMYYKRISDFQLLGKPVVENNWNNIKPIGVQNSTPLKYATTVDSKSYAYDAHSSTKIAHRIEDESAISTALNNGGFITAFRENIWGTYASAEVSCKSTMAYGTDDSGEIANIPSEYYPKALWAEVAIAKDDSNAPVDCYDQNAFKKFENRRLNLFNLIFDRNSFDKIPDISETIAADLNVNSWNQTFVNITNLYVNNITSKYVLSDKDLTVTSITAEHIDSDKFQTSSPIVVSTISANRINNSISDKLYGTNFYYKNGSFDNDMYVLDNVLTLNVANGIIDNLNVLNDIQIDSFSGQLANLPEYTNFGVEVSAKVHNEHNLSQIAAYFICDDASISPGELVQFGGSAEIRRVPANQLDPTNVLGIVLDDSEDLPAGIVLNKNLKVSDSANPCIKLVHLFGFANLAKIHGPMGVHDIYTEQHHTPHYEISGCCNAGVDFPCAKDKGVGAKLYLSEISSGLLCTEISDSVGYEYGFSVPIALLAEASDNGTALNKTEEDNFNGNITDSDRQIGGRQVAVYFTTKI